MIEIFKAWISSMLCLGIFVIFMQLIIPKANIKKYIYSLIGIVTIVTMIGPAITFFKDGNIEESASQVLANITNNVDMKKVDMEKYKKSKEEAVKDGFVEAIKNDIKSKLLVNGVKVQNVDVTLTIDYDIKKVEVNIKKINSSESTINTVNKVVDYINKEYDIDYTKIVVIEEGV